jgi:hypothetical protein
MATMPTRSATAPEAIASILPQVDRLWLFLDRFEAVPDYAVHPKIKLLRSQQEGDLRANGKLLGLALEEQDCLFFTVDDDLAYPADFVPRMAGHLAAYGERVVVGLHGSILRPPIESYRLNRRVFHRSRRMWRDHEVDVLGTDSALFSTRTWRFDVRSWTKVNMVDLHFAIQARKAGIPMVAVRRSKRWLRALAVEQPDSIYLGLVRDDREQTELARALLRLPRVDAGANRWPRLFGR